MRTNQTEDLNPGSKSATHVQTFARNFGMTRFWQLNLDKFGLLRRKLGIQFVSITLICRNFRDLDGDGATKMSRSIFVMSTVLRPRFAIFSPSRRKISAETFAIKMETIQLAQLRKRCNQTQPFPDFRDRGANGATFATKTETARP